MKRLLFLTLIVLMTFSCSYRKNSQPTVVLVNKQDARANRSQSQPNVIETDRSDLDLIDNFTVLHILKMAELNFTVPKKGDRLSAVIDYFNTVKLLKMVEASGYLYVQESKNQADDEYTYKMKMYFEDGLYTSAIVNNHDDTW